METDRPGLNFGDRFLPHLYHSDKAVVGSRKIPARDSFLLSYPSFSVVLFIFWVLRTQWNRSRFKFTFSFLLATWLWTSHLISLRQRFLIDKKKIVYWPCRAVRGFNEIVYKNPKNFARHIVCLQYILLPFWLTRKVGCSVSWEPCVLVLIPNWASFSDSYQGLHCILFWQMLDSGFTRPSSVTALGMQMKPSQELLNVKKPALLPKTIHVLSFATSAQALRSAF